MLNSIGSRMTSIESAWELQPLWKKNYWKSLWTVREWLVVMKMLEKCNRLEKKPLKVGEICVDGSYSFVQLACWRGIRVGWVNRRFVFAGKGLWVFVVWEELCFGGCCNWAWDVKGRSLWFVSICLLEGLCVWWCGWRVGLSSGADKFMFIEQRFFL